jgi:hypothetical protein
LFGEKMFKLKIQVTLTETSIPAPKPNLA